MEFKTEDFDKLFIRVDLLTKNEDPLDVFPKLQNYKKLNVILDQDLDYNRVFRFVVYLYDKNSPFRNIKDIGLRRVEAAEFVGFNKSGNGFIPQYMDIITWKNDVVNAMAVEYCRMQKSITFSKMCMREEWLYRQYEDIGGVVYEKASDKANAYKQLGTMENDLENMIQDFLNEDNTYTMQVKVMEFIEEERIVVKPETIASNIKKKRPPLGVYSVYDNVKKAKRV